MNYGNERSHELWDIMGKTNQNIYWIMGTFALNIHSHLKKHVSIDPSFQLFLPTEHNGGWEGRNH